MIDKIKKLMKKVTNDSILYKKTITICLVIIIACLSYLAYDHFNGVTEVTYNEFLTMVEEGQVNEVKMNDNGETFDFKNVDKDKFTTDNPRTDEFREFLLLNDIKVSISKTGKYVGIGLEIFKLGFIILFLVVLMSKLEISALTKKELLVTTPPKTTFADIAGNEEAKEDMEFLVNFLKNPAKYNEMGAKLPKGVVLYGPPGTGKTLTARAMAGEANVPFFNISGSDFIELYAGLGAKRVRELFADARKNTPCIVFIDEIDAIGTHRGTGSNESEKNQTINALLAELDGFDTSLPIITVVATNRVEDLDRALIRPGRFDKHIAIELPEAKDRLSILNLYIKNKKLNENINLKDISKLTIGFSGAALEAMMNEAAILAVNDNSEEINERHIHDAYFKMVVGGHKKKNNNRDYDEIELTAYHEAGHALISKLLTSNDVPKVTIIPSTTGAGGATFTIPKRMGLITKKELLNSIKILYAGRAAEYLLKRDEDEITTGASNDIKIATERIKSYYSEYGMSEFGMIGVDEKMYMPSAIKLSNELYEEILEVLEANLAILERIAKALIEKETINGEELDKLIEMGGNPDE